MVDTHAHLGLCEPGAEELVSAARDAGVRRILTVGIEEESDREAVRLAAEHEEVFACVGRHPNSAAGFDDDAAAALEALCDSEGVCAVGETGLDHYRDRAPRAEQRVAFEAQIEIARRTSLPIVIHSREATADVFETLERSAGGLGVILHCFSAGVEWARRAAANGWFCSFAGNLTYPRAEELRESAAAVPDELLLVETDAPFLAPQPVRGKPNQPANVVATAERLADLRGTAYESLERTVEANAARALGW